jgi:tRNA dimethylallyltransferase
MEPTHFPTVQHFPAPEGVKKPVVHAVVGPTASGKTAWAIRLAHELGTEIVNADSRQVYAELNIGVARPSPDELAAVPHHLVGHRSIHEPYTAFDYAEEANAAVQDVIRRTGTAVVVGGSGLYLKAALEGLDPVPPTPPDVRARWQSVWENEGLEGLQVRVAQQDPAFWATVDQKNPRRLLRALEAMEVSGKPFSAWHTGAPEPRDFAVSTHRLVPERAELRLRIAQRVDVMEKEGLVEEVRALAPFQALQALQTVGYREFYETWERGGTTQEALEWVVVHTAQYARRQETWLNKYVGRSSDDRSAG